METLEDLSYLKLNNNEKYIILKKEDLLNMITLSSKIAQSSSSEVENNSITFVPDWNRKSISLYITNDLTYVKASYELIGDETQGLINPFSIKYNILNKIKLYFYDKILIYVNSLGNYYIRLLDGDLLLYNQTSNISKIWVDFNDVSPIYETDIIGFCSLLSKFGQVSGNYTDKWVSFDGEKLSLIGNNFYIESKLKTPILCFLLFDIDLIAKLQYLYSSSNIQFFSTSCDRLHIKIQNTEILIMNIISNINNDSIASMHQLIPTKQISIDTNSFQRIMELAKSLPNINDTVQLKFDKQKNGLEIILKSDKGDSVFNLVTNRILTNPEVNCSYIDLDTLYKISEIISSSTTEISITPLYTSIQSEDLSSIILNCNI
jgi:hypothetical protein